MSLSFHFFSLKIKQPTIFVANVAEGTAGLQRHATRGTGHFFNEYRYEAIRDTSQAATFDLKKKENYESLDEMEFLF